MLVEQTQLTAQHKRDLLQGVTVVVGQTSAALTAPSSTKIVRHHEPVGESGTILARSSPESKGENQWPFG